MRTPSSVKARSKTRASNGRAWSRRSGGQLADEAGRGADVQRELDRLVDGAGAAHQHRRLVRGDGDVLQPGRGQVAADQLGVGEAEGARLVRRQHLGRGKLGRQRPDRLQRLQGPGVQRQLLPAQKGDARAGAQGAGQVGERRRRILEEHDPEPRKQRVVRRWREGHRLRVAQHHVDPMRATIWAAAGDALPRLFDQRARHVEARHPAVRAHALRQLQQRLTRPAPHVQHAFAAPQGERVDGG